MAKPWTISGVFWRNLVLWFVASIGVAGWFLLVDHASGEPLKPWWSYLIMPGGIVGAIRLLSFLEESGLFKPDRYRATRLAEIEREMKELELEREWIGSGFGREVK